MRLVCEDSGEERRFPFVGGRQSGGSGPEEPSQNRVEIHVYVHLDVPPWAIAAHAPSVAPQPATPLPEPVPIAGRIEPVEGAPILPLARAWFVDLGRRCSAGTVRHWSRYIEELISFAGWRTTADVGIQGATEWLAQKRATGWSGPTHDAAVSCLKTWGKWLYSRGHVPRNPFDAIERIGEGNGDGTRPFTTDELRRLCRAARERKKEIGKRHKYDVDMWLKLLAYTALRGEHAAALLWGDLRLDHAIPHLYIPPDRTKNKKKFTLALRPELAAQLREYRKSVPDAETDPVFKYVPNRHTLQVMRTLGHTEPGETGWHSARKWCDTELSRLGTAPDLRRQIMGHHDDLDGRYVRLPLDEKLQMQLSAILKLPSLWDDEGGGGCGKPEPVLDTAPGFQYRDSAESKNESQATHNHQHDDRGGGPSLDSAPRDSRGSPLNRRGGGASAERPDRKFERVMPICASEPSGVLDRQNLLAILELPASAQNLLIRLLREGAAGHGIGHKAG